MENENRAGANEKRSASENLGKDQECAINILKSNLKKCEELLKTCRDVLKYVAGSKALRDRIDEALNDLSRIDQ